MNLTNSQGKMIGVDNESCIVFSDGSRQCVAGGGGGAPGGFNGQIQFNDGGSFGSNNNLFWENTANTLILSTEDLTTASDEALKIGINQKLSGGGGLRNTIEMYNGGNGDININMASPSWFLHMEDGYAAFDAGVSIGSRFVPQNKLDVQGAVVIGSNYSGNNIAPSEGLLVEGSVGIGTVSPNTSLHVVGDVAAQEYCDVNGSNCFNASDVGNVKGVGVASHIAFWSDSETLSYDSNNLYWNSESNRLGVRTSNPSAVVDITNNCDPHSGCENPIAIRSNAGGLFQMDPHGRTFFVDRTNGEGGGSLNINRFGNGNYMADGPVLDLTTWTSFDNNLDAYTTVSSKSNYFSYGVDAVDGSFKIADADYIDLNVRMQIDNLGDTIFYGNLNSTGDVCITGGNCLSNVSGDSFWQDVGNVLNYDGDINITGNYYGDKFSTEGSSISLGFNTGDDNLSLASNFIGYYSGDNNSGDYVNSIGFHAAEDNTGDNVNFIGYNAGFGNRGDYSNGLGSSAATFNLGKINAIGDSAGYNNLGFNINSIGSNAGYSNSGNRSNFIGYFAGYNNSGSDSVFIGNFAGYNNLGNNVFGAGVDSSRNNVGDGLKAIGNFAGEYNSGDNVIAFGELAGYNNSGSNVIFIGNSIGRDNNKNNRLMIDVMNTNTPLIDGDFAADNLTINGNLIVTKNIDVGGCIRYNGGTLGSCI
jgi:hypothetical protein